MITFAELKNKSKELYPAVVLDAYIPYKTRKKSQKILFWVSVVLFVLVLIFPEIGSYEFVPENLVSFGEEYIFQTRSLFVLFLSFFVILNLLEGFYFSYYFKESIVDFAVAKLVFTSPKNDLTKGFLKSIIGEYTMTRLGIGSKSIKNFLDSRKNKISNLDFDINVFSESPKITVKDYASAIHKNDPEFSHFLIQHRITNELFSQTMDWVNHIQWKVRNSERWWDKQNLIRVQSLGRNWSFGKVYLLEKFGHSVMSENAYINLGDKWRIHQSDVEKIEAVLMKHSGANGILISPTNEIGMEIVSSLAKMIIKGKVVTDLEDRRIFVLDLDSLVDASRDKQTFENNLIDILVQANNAGNVILVIPHLHSVISNTFNLGVDLATLLSDFLASSKIQILAITNKKGFHETIETNNDLMQHFEKIQIRDIDKNTAIRVLQDEVFFVEPRYNVFFTYPAIDAIARSAERYYLGSTFSDKVLDLLNEVASKAKSEGKKVIYAEDVSGLISIKTGIPQGILNQSDKEELQSLEDILHKRIIGQNEAITAISDSMRRSRSGITNPKRPIGSFLFLGPTGVGKTETTKALAESFFKSEDKIIRLDMSEYTGLDAMEKLIGSSTTKTSGILSDKIRDQQYSVLLLDEFEKTSSNVKDLFLQIIDEGQFNDARGEEINCRNLIIIATSNAGSDLIYEATNLGKELEPIKNEIIDQIIKEGIFKPELLNRFDGIVLFHALMAKHLREIAKLMLIKLNKRLYDKGISINLTEELIDYLVNKGTDKKFGARSMNRVIQDKVEKLVADKIISGELNPGTSISFKLDDNGDLGVVFTKNIV